MRQESLGLRVFQAITLSNPIILNCQAECPIIRVFIRVMGLISDQVFGVGLKSNFEFTLAFT